MSLILSGTDGLSDVDGTAATPAIRGTDANTGIFFGTDIIGFSEGGVEAARINANSQFVAAAGTAALPVITTTGDLNTGIFFPAADTIAFAEGGVEAARFDSSGNFYLGPLATNFTFTNGSAVSLAGSGTGIAGNGTNLTLGAWNGPIIFQAGNSAGALVERARIDQSSGRQYFFNAGSASTVADCIFNFAGTFAANRGISVNATDSATSMEAIYFTTQSTYRGAIVCSSGGTAYNTSSDYRLKNTIAPMTGALARVAALKPCTYKWNADGADGEGFIAHELAEVCPSAVTGEKDAVDADGNIKPQGIDTSFLVATLTAAIQEQQALITQLTARITALESA